MTCPHCYSQNVLEHGFAELPANAMPTATCGGCCRLLKIDGTQAVPLVRGDINSYQRRHLAAMVKSLELVLTAKLTCKPKHQR